MGLNLSGLAALGTGYMQGQDWNQQHQLGQIQLQQAKRAETAKALSAKFMSDPDNPFWQQLAAGPTPGGAAGGGAPAAPSPAPSAPPGAAPAAGPPAMGPGAAPPSPAVAAGPAGAAQPPGMSPLGPSSMSGAAQPSGDPYMDALRTVHSIYLGLKQRNPSADPATLAEAAEQVLASTKGLQPEIKAQAQALMQLQRMQFQSGERQVERDFKSTMAQQHELWKRADAQQQFGYRQDLEKLRAGDQMARTKLMVEAANGRMAAQINARWKMFSTGLQQHAAEFQDKAGIAEYAQQAKAAFSMQAQGARELSVAANTPDAKQRDSLTKSGLAKIQQGEQALQSLGGPPDTSDPNMVLGSALDDGGGAATRAPTAAPSAPAAQRPAAARPSGRAAGGYSSAEAVRAAYQSGRLSRDRAKAILKTQFGME